MTISEKIHRLRRAESAFNSAEIARDTALRERQALMNAIGEEFGDPGKLSRFVVGQTLYVCFKDSHDHWRVDNLGECRVDEEQFENLARVSG